MSVLDIRPSQQFASLSELAFALDSDDSCLDFCELLLGASENPWAPVTFMFPAFMTSNTILGNDISLSVLEDGYGRCRGIRIDGKPELTFPLDADDLLQVLRELKLDPE